MSGVPRYTRLHTSASCSDLLSLRLSVALTPPKGVPYFLISDYGLYSYLDTIRSVALVSVYKNVMYNVSHFSVTLRTYLSLDDSYPKHFFPRTVSKFLCLPTSVTTISSF